MIHAENITKKFEDFTALDNISCTIPHGCIYGMVGSNGAGKSTFLRLLTGVYRPDSGTILTDNEILYENPEIKNRIAYIPDELYFLPGASMNRMAGFYGNIYKTFNHKRFQYLTEAFNLNPVKPINTFSKGMKRQVAIILALSCNPSYLFFDETFDGLDPVMRNLVKSMIAKDVVERDATVIITSHSLRELEDTCDQLALLHKGGMIFESDIQNLKTSLYKIQVAFSYEYQKELFSGIEILHFQKKGSVSNIIIRGNKEDAVNKLRSLSPIILDILPLSLEEVFTYEMEALGYSFSDVLEVE